MPAWIAKIIEALVDYLLVKWRGRMRKYHYATSTNAQPSWMVNSGTCAGMFLGACEEEQSSGNRAFDEYRENTIKRLEAEAAKFKEYMERLAAAKDRAEFDAFMQELQTQTSANPVPEQDKDK